MKNRVSAKASSFTESVIRDMSRQALAHGAVNLSQGFPDFPAPEDIKRAACEAINADVNQYAITWGAKRFREAIAAKTKWSLGLDIDPEREVVVTCGSTEAMIATMLAVVDPGEEVIVFEPYYENYGPDAILSGASMRYVTLYPPGSGAGGAGVGLRATPSTGVSIRTSCARRLTRRPRRSSSTRRTTRPARSSPARS